MFLMLFDEFNEFNEFDSLIKIDDFKFWEDLILLLSCVSFVFFLNKKFEMRVFVGT